MATVKCGANTESENWNKLVSITLIESNVYMFPGIQLKIK